MLFSVVCSQTVSEASAMMEAALLLLWLLSACRSSALGLASLTVIPSSSQHFEYEQLSLTCEALNAGNWTVWRYSSIRVSGDPVVSPCGSRWGSRTAGGCFLRTVKEGDSGVYWCETKHRESSNTVNITVTGGPVILQSPVAAVTQGRDVVLRCVSRASPRQQQPARFYRDGLLVGTEPAGHMTLRNFSRWAEGSYRCSAGEESKSSWLLMEGDSEPPSLSLFPDSSQLFEYDAVTLRCHGGGGGGGGGGWSVMRAAAGVLSGCGAAWGAAAAASCVLQTAKQADSGEYWCESTTKQRSNSVTINVHDGQVILESPVAPVTAGNNVTLRCRTKTAEPPRAADFYKDGRLLGGGASGHMTLRQVSRCDEGLYRCTVSGHGESPSSWIYVTDPAGPPPSSVDPPLSLLVLIRRLVVVSPYCASTVLLGSLCRRRPTGKMAPVSMTMSPGNGDEEADQPYDDVIADVIADVTTEHNF